MRVPIDWRSASRENYSLFCKTHKDVKLTYLEFITIIYEFNDSFKEYLLETGLKGKLPAGLGDFAIKKKKRKATKGKNDEYLNLPIDWAKSKANGFKKIIYNFNFDTEGFFFGWWWFRETARFKLSDLWYFKPARLTSRLITHYVRADVRYQHLYREWDKKSIKV